VNRAKHIPRGSNYARAERKPVQDAGLVREGN